MDKKILLVGGILLTLVAAAVIFTETHRPQLRSSLGEDEFTSFLKKYNIKLSGEDLQYRRSVFYDNLDFIKTQNTEQIDVVYGVNQFAIYTGSEFNQLFKGYKKVQTRGIFMKPSNVPIADSIDWRTKGAVTPVKNQGQCGSCWAFSTIGGLEGIYAIKTGKLTSFSEQQVVDCSTQNEGCNGGDLPPAYDYVLKYGIETEADYPYKGVDQKCKYDASKVVFKPTNFVQVTTDDPDALAAALNLNPVPICIEADQAAFQFYTSGIISKNCGSNLDHCVTAVGYDSNAWIVKNSWGSSWGEKGYVRIARTTTKGPGVCGIYEEPVYPVY